MICTSLKFKQDIAGVFTMQNDQSQIEVIQGTESPMELMITDRSANSAINLAGAELWMTVKRNPEDPDEHAVIRKTSRHIRSYRVLQDNNGEDTLKIESAQGGTAQNDLTLNVYVDSRYNVDADNVFTAILNQGGTLNDGDESITLSTVAGLAPGQTLTIVDGVQNPTVEILTVFLGTKEIAIDPISLTGPIADGTAVTRVRNTFADGDTTALVESTEDMRVGDAVTFTDGDNGFTVIVDSILERGIYFEPITGLGVAEVLSDAAGEEVSFYIDVYRGEDFLESTRYLNMQPTSADHYVVTKLENESEWIIATNLNSTSPAPDNIPENAYTLVMAGGEDPSGGIRITNAQAGICEIDLEAADTSALTPRQYFYDVKLKQPGRQVYPVGGIFHVRRAITAG